MTADIEWIEIFYEKKKQRKIDGFFFVHIYTTHLGSNLNEPIRCDNSFLQIPKTNALNEYFKLKKLILFYC